MKILVVGSYGQLGKELEELFVTGKADIGPIDDIYRDADVTYVDIDTVDITDAAAVDALMDEGQFDAVINCAAFTNVDACEHENLAAFAANATGPANLASACERHGAKLVQVSTDYVLAGNNPEPQTEGAAVNPQSSYGRSKLAGEHYVAANCSRAFIVRTAWLYGKVGKNFVRTMLRISADHEFITVVDDQIGSPTYANDLAYEILKILPTENYGIYHATGNGQCSWYDFASAIIKRAGRACEVRPISTAEYAAQHPEAAPRPAFSILDNKHLRDTVGDDMRPWEEALESFMTYLEKQGEI